MKTAGILLPMRRKLKEVDIHLGMCVTLEQENFVMC